MLGGPAPVSSAAGPRSGAASRIAWGILLIALAAASSGCARRETDPRPDVLLLSVDTLRADRLGYAGHAAARTPNLDRLAAEGAVFSAAQATIPRTTQSLASLLTSQSPAAHGVRNLGDPLRADAVTLATLLRDAGYWTGAVSANGTAGRDELGRGFDHFTESATLQQRYGVPTRGIRGAEPVVGSAESVTREALRVLDGRPAPRLLWVHYMDPHFLYNPPAPFNQVIDWGRFDFYRTRGRYRPVKASTYFDLHGLSSAALAEVSSLYDAEIAYADHWIGKLLDGLERDTLVVFTSDHGESLGEHGYFYEHGDYVYQASLAVPLVLWWPGHVAGGTRIATPVSLLDVLPTLLGLLGMPPPADLGFEGIDLGRLLRGEEASGERALFGESGAALLDGNPRRPKGGERWTCVRRGRWKLVRVPGSAGAAYELYDLDADPGETRDLSALEPARMSALRDVLDDWRREHAAPERPARRDPELESRLRELGYLE